MEYSLLGCLILKTEATCSSKTTCLADKDPNLMFKIPEQDLPCTYSTVQNTHTFTWHNSMVQ
jgi:hypothetical protein